MNKLLIFLTLLGLFSCNVQIDEPTFYEVIQPEPPPIEEPPYEESPWYHFEIGYDTLNFLIENPPLDITQLYENDWMDKLIAEREKKQKEYETE